MGYKFTPQCTVTTGLTAYGCYKGSIETISILHG